MDFVFPYLVQFLKEYSSKVDLLMEDRREVLSQRSAMEDAHKSQQAQSNAYLALMPLALPAPPTADYSGGAPQGYGAPPQQAAYGGFQQQF